MFDLTGRVALITGAASGIGITANAVAPGVIRTPQALDPVNSLGPEGMEAVAARIPAGRSVRRTTLRTSSSSSPAPKPPT